MDVLLEISVAVVGAATGAILSYCLPLYFAKRKNLTRRDIMGEWHSSYLHYQSASTSKNWIKDRVTISVDGPHFKFNSIDNPLNDVYEANAKLKNGELIGDWKSTTSDGRHAQGGFVLTVLPMGGLLYGIFTGPRDSGERVFAAWVLGKTLEDLEKGKRLVRSQVLIAPLPTKASKQIAS